MPKKKGKGRPPKGPLKRRANTRAERYRILVKCEGETERTYFQHARRELRNLATCEVSTFKRGVRKFVEKGDQEGCDEVWLVFDKDDMKNDDFDRCIENAQGKKWRVGWSNPCFELWLELHLRAVNKRVVNQQQQNERWKHAFKEEFGREVGKRLEKNDLREIFPRMESAIEHAQQLSRAWEKEGEAPSPAKRNPYTEVFRLAQRLREIVKEK